MLLTKVRCAGAGLLVCALVSNPATGASLSCSEMEEFLAKAEIKDTRGTSKGITLPSRARMELGSVSHEALIQTIDESKSSFQSQRGTELNFRDSWKFNVAGYEIAKMLELNMVPPYIERKARGKTGSFSWWINDAMMELDRTKQKIEPPDQDSWNKQMWVVRVFHQLIHDTDPNLTNILITKDWQIWMIDFTRAFRWMKNLPNAKNLVRCDRKVLANLRKLKKEDLDPKLTRWLNKPEIEGVIARAQKIVEYFDKEIAAKGEAEVLFDLPRANQPCGTGI